jgi:hypothetical protein
MYRLLKLVELKLKLVELKLKLVKLKLKLVELLKLKQPLVERMRLNYNDGRMLWQDEGISNVGAVFFFPKHLKCLDYLAVEALAVEQNAM